MALCRRKVASGVQRRWYSGSGDRRRCGSRVAGELDVSIAEPACSARATGRSAKYSRVMGGNCEFDGQVVKMSRVVGNGEDWCWWRARPVRKRAAGRCPGRSRPGGSSAKPGPGARRGVESKRPA
jgi:hypothetical protein